MMALMMVAVDVVTGIMLAMLTMTMLRILVGDIDCHEGVAATACMVMMIAASMVTSTVSITMAMVVRVTATMMTVFLVGGIGCLRCCRRRICCRLCLCFRRCLRLCIRWRLCFTLCRRCLFYLCLRIFCDLLSSVVARLCVVVFDVMFQEFNSDPFLNGPGIRIILCNKTSISVAVRVDLGLRLYIYI